MNDENQPQWDFMEYKLFNGRGAVSKWLTKCKKVDDSSFAQFTTIIETLAALKKELWDLPDYRAKMVNMEGIGEIRFENKQKKQLRVFGTFKEEDGQYIMLGGAVKDGKNNYDPSDIFNTVKDRRDEIIRGVSEIVPYVDNDENDDENTESEA